MDVYVSVQFFDPQQVLKAAADSPCDGLWAVVKPFVRVSAAGDSIDYKDVLNYFTSSPDDLTYLMLHQSLAAKCPELRPVPFHPGTRIGWLRAKGASPLTIGDSIEPMALQSHWSDIVASNSFDFHIGVDEKNPETSVAALAELECAQVDEVHKWRLAFHEWADRQGSDDDVRKVLQELFEQPAQPEADRQALLEALRSALLIPKAGLLEVTDPRSGRKKHVHTDSPTTFQEKWSAAAGVRLRTAYHLLLKQNVPIARAGLRWPVPPVFRYEPAQLCKPEVAERFPRTTDHDTYAEHVFCAWRTAFEAAAVDERELESVGNELTWFMSAGERLFWPKATAEPGLSIERDWLLIDASKPPSGELDIPLAATDCGIDAARFHWVSSLSLLGMTHRLYDKQVWAQAVAGQAGALSLPELRIDNQQLLSRDRSLAPASFNPVAAITDEHSQMLAEYAQQVRFRRDGQLVVGEPDVKSLLLEFSAPGAGTTPPACGHVLWSPSYKQMDAAPRTLQREHVDASGRTIDGLFVYSTPMPLLDLLEEHPPAHLPEPTSDRSADPFVSMTPQRLLLRYQAPQGGAEIGSQSDLLPMENMSAADGRRYALAFPGRVRALPLGDSTLTERSWPTFEHLTPGDKRRVLELEIASIDGNGVPYDETDLSYVQQTLRQVVRGLPQNAGAPAAIIGYLTLHAEASDRPWHALTSTDVIGMERGDSSALYWLLPRDSEAWDAVDSATLVLYSSTLADSKVTPFNMVIAPRVTSAADPNVQTKEPAVVLAPSKFFEIHFGHSADLLAFAVSYRRQRPSLRPVANGPLPRLRGYIWRQIRSAAKGWLWMHPKGTPAQSIRLTQSAHLRPVHLAAEPGCSPDSDLGPAEIHQAFSFTEPFRGGAYAEHSGAGMTAGEKRYELWRRAGMPHQLVLGLDHQYGFRRFTGNESALQFTPKLSAPIVHPADVTAGHWSGEECEGKTGEQGTMPLLSWRLRDARYVEMYLDPGILVGLFQEPDDTKLLARREDYLRQAYESLQELCAGSEFAEHTVDVEGWTYHLTESAAATSGGSRSRSPASALKWTKTLSATLTPPADVPSALRDPAHSSLREVVQQLRAWVNQFPTPKDPTQARQLLLLQSIDLGASEDGTAIQKCDVVRVGLRVKRNSERVIPESDLAGASTQRAMRLMRFRHDENTVIAGLPAALRVIAKPEEPDNELVPRRAESFRATALERARKYLPSVSQHFRWVPRSSSAASPATDGRSELERCAALTGGGEAFSVVLREQPRIAGTGGPVEACGANAWFYTVPLAFAPTKPWGALRDHVSTQEFIEYLLEVLESLCRGRGSLLQQIVHPPGQPDPSALPANVRTVAAAIGAARELRNQIAERLARDFLAIVEDAEPCGELLDWTGRFGAGAAAKAMGTTDEEDVAADKALLSRVVPLRAAVVGERRKPAGGMSVLRKVVQERLRQDLTPVWTAKGFAAHIIDPDSPAAHRIARAQITKVIRRTAPDAVGQTSDLLQKANGDARAEVAEARFVLDRIAKSGQSARLRWMKRVHREWLAAQLSSDAGTPTRRDVDQFSLSDLHVAPATANSKAAAFIVDMLDDVSYDNEFEILHAGCRAQAIDDQLVSVPPGSSQTRHTLDEARDGKDRQIELVPVHHNPEWRQYRRAANNGWELARSYYLLPSRRPPRPAQHVDLAEPARQGPLPQQFRICNRDQRMGTVLDALLSGTLSIDEPEQLQGTTTREWKRYCDWLESAAAEEERLDVYLHRVCFILEGDEEANDLKLKPEERIFAAFANNLMRVDIEAMAPGLSELAAESAGTSHDAGQGGIFEKDSKLAKWYRLHRHQQLKDENATLPGQVPIADVLAELTWFFAETGQEHGTPPQNLAQWKLLVPPDVPDKCDDSKDALPAQTMRYSLQIESPPQQGRSRTLVVRPAETAATARAADGRLVAAGLYVCQDPAVQKGPVRLALQLVFLCSSFKQYRVRVAAIRNARDVDLDGDPDINPAFRMEAPAAWVNLGHVSMRSQAAFSRALPDSAPSSAGAGSWTLFRPLPKEVRQLAARPYRNWCRDGLLFAGGDWSVLFADAQGGALARSFGFHADEQLFADKQSIEIRAFHYEVPLDHAQPFGIDGSTKLTPLFEGRRDGLPDERAEAEPFAAGRLFVDNPGAAQTWARGLLNVGPGMSEAYGQCVCVEWLVNGISALRIDGWPIRWKSLAKAKEPA